MNSKKINYLKQLILLKKCTVQDLKVEALLIVVLSLLTQYIEAEKKGLTTSLLKENSESHNSNSALLLKTSIDIHTYLTNQVMSEKRLNEIISDYSLSKKHYQKAMLVEPIGFFYDVLVAQYTSKINYLCKNSEGKIVWIPELLAFNLLLGIKEQKNYTFKRFAYLNTIDLDSVKRIFRLISHLKNQEEGIKLFAKNDKDKNIITKMNIISNSMIGALVRKKYKN